ncbi:MAG TPA: sialidase family protein [Candidatus Limnocylindrales bacterium]
MRRIAGPIVALMALLLAVSPVLAATWTKPLAITSSHDAFTSFARSLATGSGVVHLVDARAAGNLDYRRSTDGGLHWSHSVTLAQPSSRYPVVLGDPAIGAFGSLVVFAYRANDATAAYLIVRVSHDAGLSWSGPKTIAKVVTTRRIGEQSVAVSSAGIFVAWTNRVTGSIIVQRSTDQGATFHTAQRVGVTTATFSPGDPTFTDGLIGLAASGSDVDLAWSPSGDGQADTLVLSRSTDGGVSYLAPASFLAKPSFGFPSLSASGSFLVGEVLGTDGAVIGLSSKDGGGSIASHRLAGPGDASGLSNGSVAVDSSGNIVLTYSRTGSVRSVPSSVLVRRSADGGSHWTPFETVAASSAQVEEIDAAFVAGGTLLVWTACVDPDGTNCDIFESRGP